MPTAVASQSSRWRRCWSFSSPHYNFAPMNRTLARATTTCNIPVLVCALTWDRRKFLVMLPTRFPFSTTASRRSRLTQWASPSRVSPSTNPLQNSKPRRTNLSSHSPERLRPATSLRLRFDTKVNRPRACTSSFPTRIIRIAPGKSGRKANPKTHATTFPPTTIPTIV